MGRTEIGFSLHNPVLKHGSSRFTQTQAGFDTGERTFVVDREHLERSLPELETPDSQLTWGAVDNFKRGIYRGMFVSSVGDITELGNNLCEYTVKFLGLIKAGKRPYTTEQASNTSAINMLIIGEKGFASVDTTPIVSVVAVSDVRPNVQDLGTNLVPPGYPALLPPQSLGGISIRASAFEAWVLRERDTRKAGTLYETQSQFVYERVR